MTLRQSNYIKLIAMLTMLIDHIGVVLFPDAVILRVIGRISFPLFAFQLGIGYDHTGNFSKYLTRLFAFGLVIQTAYAVGTKLLAPEYDSGTLNIFFTLTLGLATIHFYQNRRYVFLLAVFIISAYLDIDYGIYGVALILLLHINKNRKQGLFSALAILGFAYCYLHQDYIQMFSLASLIFLLKPLEPKMHIPSYTFYLFYPLHLLLLYTAQRLFFT